MSETGPEVMVKRFSEAFSLARQNVLMTGASGGLGKSIAPYLFFGHRRPVCTERRQRGQA
jgi:NADP-dependent 3-hydroxy acid dehydrogenase YdfG